MGQWGNGRLVIKIDPGDKTPYYLQIIRQVREGVATGKAKPGEELPTIRALAERLEVTPNTVVRAYRELEMAGVVVKRSTNGSFISGKPGSDLGEQERARYLAELRDEFLAKASRVGAGVKELIKLLRQGDQGTHPRVEE
jgi:GntR family transcriptional regulator